MNGIIAILRDAPPGVSMKASREVAKAVIRSARELEKEIAQCRGKAN